MKYSNDENDRKKRKHIFYSSVYILPALSFVLSFLLIYFLANKGYLPKKDKEIAFVFSAIIAVFIWGYYKKYWLKMPDGSYHNIKAALQSKAIKINAPKSYEQEFFYSKKKTILVLFLAIPFLGVGIVTIVMLKSILIPLFTMSLGLLIVYSAITTLLDKSAALKLGKTGLWTKKLGFVDWDDIIGAQVIKKTENNTTTFLLEIFIKGTVYSKANEPDETLNINNIANKQIINGIISNLRDKRHQLD